MKEEGVCGRGYGKQHAEASGKCWKLFEDRKLRECGVVPPDVAAGRKAGDRGGFYMYLDLSRGNAPQ